jgi:hypothetical protein
MESLFIILIFLIPTIFIWVLEAFKAACRRREYNKKLTEALLKIQKINFVNLDNIIAGHERLSALSLEGMDRFYKLFSRPKRE